MGRAYRLRPEDAVQKAYFDFLCIWEKRYPTLHWIHSIPNGTNKTEAERAVFKATGLTAGVWDVFVPIPRIHSMNGAPVLIPGLYLEFKAGEGKLEPEQEDFLNQVIKPYGYLYGVYYGWKPAARQTFEYLGITNENIRKELEGK